jgi:hypothetical protein
VVKWLLEEKAQINEHVTREHYITKQAEKHYNVLHAACYASGRGGNSEVIMFLLRKSAEVECNSDGLSPLDLLSSGNNRQEGH